MVCKSLLEFMSVDLCESNISELWERGSEGFVEFKISKIDLRKDSAVQRGSISSSAQFGHFLFCTGFLIDCAELTQNAVLCLLLVPLG